MTHSNKIRNRAIVGEIRIIISNKVYIELATFGCSEELGVGTPVKMGEERKRRHDKSDTK